MIGITPAHDHPNYALMRDLGVQWVRQGYVFPFADRIGGALSDTFLRSEEQVERYLAEGFSVLASFPGPAPCATCPTPARPSTTAPCPTGWAS